MGERLLIVDDESAICELIRDVAEPMGFEVEVTSEGKGFLEAYDREEPALICMDIVLPEVDGLELLRNLSERGCNSPILIISGYNRLLINSDKNLGESFGLPYVRPLPKPFRVKALQDGLRDVARHTQ